MNLSSSLSTLARRKNCLLAAGLSAGITLLAYALLGWWPFGGGTILTGDLNGLYVNYIADLWRRVRQGGLFYSFGKLAGGSTLGLFAYYMNSPFNLLYLLFPVRCIPQVAGTVFLLRTALTAVCFCWYLQRHLGRETPLAAVLAQGYSLCAFCVVYNQNIIWMDVVWLLPLVLDALDSLLETGRHWRFTWLVFACMLLNFYTAWAACLFCVLYFLFGWAAKPRAKGLLIRRFGVFAASGVLAAGLALFFLVPVLLEVQESKGALFELAFTLEPQFPLWQLPYRLFTGTFFWQDIMHGLPNLYCGAFAAALAALYFFGGAPRREKLAFAGLLAALVLSFWVKGFDLIWHGFKEPVWFPYRYSFVFSAVVLVLAGKALLGGALPLRAYLGAGAVCALWLAGYRPAVGAELFSLFKLALCALACLGALALCYLWQHGLPEAGGAGALCRRAAAVCFALLAAGELCANTVLSLRKFESYSLESFTEFYDNASASLNAARAVTPGYYRVEGNFLHTLNDPFLLGYWGISHYSSTKASAAKELLENLGYIGYSTYGWGSTGVADSLLGIRYLYSDGSRPAGGHFALRPELSAGYDLYENEAAFPLAWLADAGALTVDAAAGAENTFALQNAALDALLPGLGAGQALVDVSPAFSTTEKGTLRLEFAAPCDGACYLAIPGTDNLLPIDVVLDGELYAQYFEGDSLGGVLPLGRFAAGQPVTLELGAADSEELRAHVQVYSLNTPVLQAAAEAARQSAPQEKALTIREGGRIDVSATVNGSRSLLVIPFSYDENWVAKVNGQPVSVQALLGGLLAVELPQGECTVTLRYRHPGVGAGFAGSAVFVVLALVWQRKEKKRS